MVSLVIFSTNIFIEDQASSLDIFFDQQINIQ